jgi:hypothetical protein
MYPDEQIVVIDGEEVRYPGLVEGKFSSGDFADPEQKPSFIPAETINLLVDNLSALITAAGGAPNNASVDQLVSAISSAAAAKKVVQRDNNGRAQFVDPSVGADAATKNYVDSQISARAMPLGAVCFQGPHDLAPSAIWGGTWEDVSYEEKNLTRRCVGNIAGQFFSGMPARLAVSVAGGVPSITIVAGGTGYLSGGDGSLSLVVVGPCTTQMVATATVVNGVITAIGVVTPGAGYTSGAAEVYDVVAAHNDRVQGYDVRIRVDTNEGSGNATPLAPGGAVTSRGTPDTTNVGSVYLGDGGYGTRRLGLETAGAWIIVKKWRRIA